MPVVKTCSTTLSPGMMAASGGANLTRWGAARPFSRRCFSTRCGFLQQQQRSSSGTLLCGVGHRRELTMLAVVTSCWNLCSGAQPYLHSQ